jgi:alanine racemase
LSFVSRPTRARVDLGAVVSNFRLFRRRTQKRVLCVVKADAYGHGAVPVARALEGAGADFFCVAIAEEAVGLRRAGLRSPILLLNYSRAGDVALHRAYGLTPTLSSLAQIREFEEATRGFPAPLPVHLKIDTGLTRLGILPGEIPEAASVLRRSHGLDVEAVFTHFSHGDEPEGPFVESQSAAAREAFEAAGRAGIAFRWRHLANSGAALAGKGIWCEGVRPGLSLYGVLPRETDSEPEIRAAMTWETEVIAVKRVAPGTAVGYGGRFVTRRPSALAVLPIGYHDGYRRAFAGRVPVLFRGGPAPIAGVISMDLTVCDVTDFGATLGEPAVLMGRTEKGCVTAHDLARAADTIPYEIFSGIGARVPRVHS